MISGDVDLSSATIDGCLMLKYRVNDDHKVSLSDSRVTNLHLEIMSGEHVGVDLHGAVITSFLDTRESWPKVFKLDRLEHQLATVSIHRYVDVVVVAAGEVGRVGAAVGGGGVGDPAWVGG